MVLNCYVHGCGHFNLDLFDSEYFSEWALNYAQLHLVNENNHAINVGYVLKVTKYTNW